MNPMKTAMVLIVMLIGIPVSAQEVELELRMPAHTFHPGMTCSLDLSIRNTGSALNDARLFVALNIGTSEYWFYPSWCRYPDQLDWEDISIPGADQTVLSILPEFVWPDNMGSFSGAIFIAAMIHQDNLTGNPVDYEFGWDDTIPTVTPTPTFSPLPSATPTPSPLPWTHTPTPMPTGFVTISPGTVQMGSPEDEACRNFDEGPVHTVQITGVFYIRQTETTQQQWLNVFGTNPSGTEGTLLPVTDVTWYDACIYCNRLSTASGFKPCYYADEALTVVFNGTPPVTEGTVYWDRTAYGYRLPTEAEWEYACRAGTTTPYNNGMINTECWGEDTNLDPLAWYEENCTDMQTIATKAPNSFDLYDMHGNVWEWCWDRYESDYYETSPDTDPAGPSTGSYRVLRGGSWNHDAQYCRSARRGNHAPGYRAGHLGFRILRNVP